MGWGMGVCTQDELSQAALELSQPCVPTPHVCTHGSASCFSPGIRASAGRALSGARTLCSLEESHFLDCCCAFGGFLRDHGGGAGAGAQRASLALGLLPGWRRRPALTGARSRGRHVGLFWGWLPTVAPGEQPLSSDRGGGGGRGGRVGGQGMAACGGGRGLAFAPHNCPLTLVLASASSSQSLPLGWAWWGPFETQRRGGWAAWGLSVLPPAQCRGLCSWLARKQVWSALRSPQTWGLGHCWGPRSRLYLWPPDADAGCPWLLATGRAVCCPKEGRKPFRSVWVQTAAGVQIGKCLYCPLVKNLKEDVGFLRA